MKKTLIIVVVLLIIVGGGIALWKYQQKKATPAAKPPVNPDTAAGTGTEPPAGSIRVTADVPIVNTQKRAPL